MIFGMALLDQEVGISKKSASATACYGFCLPPGLGTWLGGAALALGAHAGCLLYLVALLPLPPFFRLVVLV